MVFIDSVVGLKCSCVCICRHYENLLQVFFVVRLRTPHEIHVSKNHQIVDPDPLVSSDIMDGRDNFLMTAREKHYEFSSLRRAKHSSMVMLYELHTQAKDNFDCTCNSCKTHIDTYYHCSVCEVGYGGFRLYIIYQINGSFYEYMLQVVSII